jgi:hypothetical protein
MKPQLNPINPLGLQWYEHPSLTLQLANLSKERNDLREHNLFEGEGMRPEDTPEPTDEAIRARTPEGEFNDLGCPYMGAKGTGFGRNVPIEKTVVDRKNLLNPDPREISRRLMARDTFKPAGILNALGAAWLQFENHNWFFHGNGDPQRFISIPLQEGDDFPENPMIIRDTLPMHGGEIKDGCPAPVFANAETHWWDGSQIYGSGREKQATIRTFEGGRIKVDENGRLLKSDIPGVDLTGMQENYWFGPGLLHTLAQRGGRGDRQGAPGPVRPAALRTRRARRLGPDRQDPHGRVDAVRPAPPGAADRHERQLVRRTRRDLPGQGRSHRRLRGPVRHHRVLDRSPQRTVLADRGVRLGLPDAPAHPGRLVVLLPGER